MVGHEDAPRNEGAAARLIAAAGVSPDGREALAGRIKPAPACRTTILWGGAFLLLVGLGAYFRFADLQRQYYWHDEAGTFVEASGYTGTEVAARLFDGRMLTAADVRRYQRPAADRTPLDTVAAQARDDVRHPPLYYLIASIWLRLFPDEAAPLRALSALFGLLTVVGIYWLCLELFGSHSTALVACALVLVSPFNVLYSREAREYSLLTLIVALSTAALLRALRRNTPSSWAFYGLTLASGLYTQPIFVLTMIAHAIYAIAREGLRPTRRAGRYLLSSLLSVLIFLPWIGVILRNRTGLFGEMRSPEQLGWMPSISVSEFGDTVFLNLASPFADFAAGDHEHRATIAALVSATAVWILVAYCLWRVKPPGARLLVFALIAVPLAAFLLPGLLRGARDFTAPQYFVQAYVGMELAVAHVLASGVRSDRWRRQTAWVALGAVLIVGGIVSCRASFGAERWWNKRSLDTPSAARVVNQAADPLVLVSGPWPTNLGNVLSLSHYLDPAVRLQLLAEPYETPVPDLSREAGQVFVFGNSWDVLIELDERRHYRVEEGVPDTLWRVVRERS